MGIYMIDSFLLPICLLTAPVEPVQTFSSDGGSSITNVSTYMLSGLNQDADGDDAANQYIRLQVGGNFAFDTSINDDDSSAAGSVFSLNNGKIKFDPGVDLQVTWGIAVWDALAIEISSGFAYNSVSSVEGDWSSPLFPGQSAGTTGGTGHSIAVPVMVGLGYSFGVSDSFTLGINAAVGVQFTHADVSGVGVDTPLPLPFPLNGAQASVNGTGASFRYQVGATADWAFSHVFGMGVYVRYSGTTEANFGTPTFNTPFIVGTSDVKVDDVSMLAVGLAFYFDF